MYNVYNYISFCFVAPSTQNISWCKIECTADSLSSVVMATEQSPPPPMTILSLSMKTILNTNSKANEVGVSLLVHRCDNY